MSQIEIVTNELRQRGINQKDFCKSVDIGETTFSNWKVKNMNIPSKYISRIANYFNWPVDKLFEAESEIQKNESQTNVLDYCIFPEVTVEQQVFSMLHKLPLEEKLEIMLEITRKANSIDEVQENTEDAQ